MRFRGKVIYYIVTQTAQASIQLMKQMVKRNPGAMATYFAARMIGDLILPSKRISTLRRSK
ncbi:MAG: hypothetical protein DKT66_12945 [Candidatus Melainabacteria bacterium]|nr:MAG: hypothetical protein DKT66_12945 [Candidatus Melainabacteria bacterium]